MLAVDLPEYEVFSVPVVDSVDARTAGIHNEVAASGRILQHRTEASPKGTRSELEAAAELRLDGPPGVETWWLGETNRSAIPAVAARG